MSVRAWPISFLTLSGSEFGFCCFRLCRSTPNIPVKPPYRRALATLLPSVNLDANPLDVPPNKTNILACMDNPSASSTTPQCQARYKTSG